MEEPMLPPAYYLDESDPDILLLRRQDDTFVAAFGAQGRHIEAGLQGSRRQEEAPKPPDKGTAHDVEDS